MRVEIEYIEETRQDMEILVEQIQSRFWIVGVSGGLSEQHEVPVFKRIFEIRLRRMETVQSCLSCNSKGFNTSVLGPHRCEFCDGTFSGNPPTEQDVKEEQERLKKEAERAP